MWGRTARRRGALLKLGFRLLLIVGHTLGDFALPLMETQCQRAGTTLDRMTPAHAEQVLPVVERVLSGFVVRPADLAAIMHELRVAVGEERFASGDGAGSLLTAATEP